MGEDRWGPGGVGTRATFRDADLQRTFTAEGIVEFPALGAADLSRFRALHSMRTPSGQGFDPDFDASDRDLVAATTALAREVLAPVVAEALVDHRIVFATLVAKHVGEGSGMEAHDDRTYVDERRHRAVTLWIPLVDTSEEIGNGPLRVVPGSHRLATTPAGTNTPDWYRPFLEPLARGAITFPCSAGHALAYDSRTVHLSPPNESGQVRLAVAAVVVPDEAPLVHVEAVDASRRRLYRVDDEFYVRHAPRSLRRRMADDLEVLDEFDVEEPVVSVEEVAQLLHGDVAPFRAVEPHPALPDLSEPVAPPGGRAERALHRVIGRGPVPQRSLDTVPWLSEVVAGWRFARREFVDEEAELGRPGPLPWIGAPQEAEVDGRWAVLPLDPPTTSRWCPETGGLLADRPGLLEAELWVLGPGTLVGPRAGVRPGTLRLLVGLTMPVRPAGIAFDRRVIGLPMASGTLYDEAHPHVLFNEGDDPLPLLTVVVADPARPRWVRSAARGAAVLSGSRRRSAWLREASAAGGWTDG